MLFCWGTNLNPPHSSTQNAKEIQIRITHVRSAPTFSSSSSSRKESANSSTLLSIVMLDLHKHHYISHQTISSPSALPQNRTDRFPGNSRKSTPKHRNRIKSTFRTSHITSLGPVDWWFLAKKFNPNKEEIDEVENFSYRLRFHWNLW